MKDSLNVLVYAMVLGLVCALLLTGAARFTEPYRRVNARAEEIRHILNVLDVPHNSQASAAELEEIFERSVSERQAGGLTRYEYVPSQSGGRALAVAVPFSGQGVWGPIKGFLAMEPDMNTIRGVTFHEQEETPGLGGEIASAWFRNQFKGKSIVDAAGNSGIRIKGGGAAKPNGVDAISGATMTSEKVEKMLNATIRQLVDNQDSQ